VGVVLRKKPKDLSGSEREECGDREGVGVYDTLLQSDTVQSYGHGKEERGLGLWGLSWKQKNQRT
jgi:hypothetical protein